MTQPSTPNTVANQDAREWMPPQYKSPARRTLVVLGARIKPEWLNRTVSVVQVSFIGDLGQMLSDLAGLASSKKGKNLPTNRLKASMALSLDGVILIDRQLGLSLDRPRPAIELYNEALDHDEVIERVRQCLRTWNNDVVQSWAQANGLGEAAERLSQAIRADGISVRTVAQPLINRSAGSRLGRPVYHLIARRLAEELVGTTLFDGMSPVDLVVDPSNTSASVDLLTQPVRMGDTRNMFSMAARLSVFTMPNSRDLFVKVTPIKRIWSSELPGRKPNVPNNVSCTVMVPGKPFLTVRASQVKVKPGQDQGEAKAPTWAFSDEYEEFLVRAKGQLPATLQDAVAEVAPDPSKGGWWIGFPRLTTLFDRVGGRTVFERDEHDLHETMVQRLPWALDARLEFRRVKAVAQKAAAAATHIALKPSDIGHQDDLAEPGHAGQSLSEENLADDERPLAVPEGGRAARLEIGRASNVAALQVLYPGKPVHLFLFGGEPREQDIIRACADVLFGDAVMVHTEALPLNTHGLQSELEKSGAKSLERFEARVARWTEAFSQLPQDDGVRHVMICADRMIGRRTEDPVNYYAAIHAACYAAGANVHHVLPIQEKRGKEDVPHFVHRVQSAMLDVFLAHSGVVLGAQELVEQTLMSKAKDAASNIHRPRYVCGIQAVRSRARRRSAEDDVSFLLYSRLSLSTGLVDIKIACRVGKKDTTTEWMGLASGLRWLGSQRNISSNENWLRDTFLNQTRTMLAQLAGEDPRAIVLMDWQRLANLWSSLKDENLCESPPGTLTLGGTELNVACPGMTFVRLRSTREASMTMRNLTAKLYEGWVSRPQGLEQTGEVYTERYLGPAHEIVEVIASDANERQKAGRISNKHYLQVMRYRRTVQLLRGFSCYRTTERMKEIDESGDGDKRFRIVQLDPQHEDAALPTTMESTIVTGPSDLDPDQVVRLVMGLRLRYAHYPDWTALPAPLFFIAKVDDYVIRYTDLTKDDTDSEVETADAAEVPETIPLSEINEAVMAGSADLPLPNNHDPYFDDVSRAIGEQLPQLQLFDDSPDHKGGTQTMPLGDREEGYKPGSNQDVYAVASTPTEVVARETSAGEGSPFECSDGGQAEAAIASKARVSVEAQGADGSAAQADDERSCADPEEDQAPQAPLMAKAWGLIKRTPVLFTIRDLNIKRLYEDMMKLNLHVAVELPWFVNVDTVVPADAWPDHKTINKFWRQQGNMGLRQQTKAAPKTNEFKTWVMQRLRIPQSSWAIGPVFKGNIRVFSRVYELYDEMLLDNARHGEEAPSVAEGFTLNYIALTGWLKSRDGESGGDDGLGWLITMAAHWPGAPNIEEIFTTLDGFKLGPKASCALEYLIDCCEVSIELADTPAAKRRNLIIHRRRDPRWEEMALAMQVDHSDNKNDDDMAQEQQGKVMGANQIGAQSLLTSGSDIQDMFDERRAKLLPNLSEFPVDVIQKMMVTCVDRLVPGSDNFDLDASNLEWLCKHLSGRHQELLQNREREDAARRAAEEQALAKLAEQAMRKENMDLFFGQLSQACASVPEDMLHEPIKISCETQFCEEFVLSLGNEAFIVLTSDLQENLEVVKSAAAEMAAKHVTYDGLDAGTDERLAAVTGLARRQLKTRLQDEIIVSARKTNDALVTAMLAIDSLLRTGKALQQASEQARPKIQESPALASGSDSKPGDKLQARVPAVTTKQELASTTDASAADSQHDVIAKVVAEIPVEALLGAHVPSKAAASPKVAPEVEPAAQVPAIEEAAPVTAKGPLVDAAAHAAVDIAQADTVSSTSAPEIGEPASAGPGAVASEPVDDAENDEIPGDLDDLEVTSLPPTTIEVDTQVDARALLAEERLAPVQRAAQFRYWRLAKVGVAALCAMNPHPVVEAHGAAWTSMLDSLSALMVPGGEQNLSPKLMKWLESSSAAASSNDAMPLALDIGILGAGLLPILFEGHEAKIRWAVLSRIATRMQEHEPLRDLCDHLQSLDTTALRITRDNLSSARVAPRKALEAELLRQRDRAINWPSDSALFRNWPNPEYWEMHGAMFDDRHGMHFHKALQHVARGANDHLRKMMPELRKYVEKISGTLGDLRKRTGRKRALEGPHAEKLAQNVHTTIAFLEGYLDLGSRLSNVTTGDIPRPLREFLDKLHAKTLAASEYIGEIVQGLPTDGQCHSEEVVMKLHATLAQQIMQTTLALMNEQVPATGVSDDAQMLLMEMPLNSALEPVWSVKLDDETPETVLRDQLKVLEEVGAVTDQLVEATAKNIRIDDLLINAAEMHRSNDQLLPARIIEQRLRHESPQVQSLMKTTNEAAHRRMKVTLAEELADARQRVTNALSVGPMTQAEASHMLKIIELLDRANRDNTIGAIGPMVTPYEDYPQARALLHNLILVPLKQRIHESLLNLKSDMRSFREELEKKRSGDSNIDRKIEQLDRIEAGLKEVTPTNIRVARYSFSLLQQDELPFIRLQSANPAQDYEAFQKELHAFSSGRTPLESLRDALATDDAKHWPKGQKPAWAVLLDAAQREEAAAFLDAWMTLTEARTISEIHEPLAKFFRAAGTVEDPMALSEPGSNGRTAFHLAARTFVGSARVQNFWVPPVLGSAARDLRGVVLRHRPQPELIAQVIEELPVTTPNLVLGRARLPMSRRAAITRDHPVILVDDDLVAYMAVHPEQRLAKMMEVGLLTFRDNPYDDYGGPVPHEMFFGRRSEQMRLKNNKSALVLYGGRRLGKSSLLDRIQFESRQNLVHTPNGTRGEVAIYIPLESKIDSAAFGDDYQLFAWMGIYRGMVNNKFIESAKTEPKTADSLREYIRSEIMANKALTGACYLLIDEADEVMARDIENAGAFASSLRGLCDDVRDVCQIRYVIAGLHNLTRMHTEGNTALAKADAIALQPFSSGQDILMGVDLITKPLAALGFVFPKGSEELPMRILAMCNFYPAFVQLYCKNLIEDLYNKRGHKSPITQIETSDLDKVERNKDFLGVMQEKFRYNLDLDKRYKGIALVLADTYYSGSGIGVDQGMEAIDIRDLCNMLFPNHFSTTGEGAFPALLEEMETLTIIDRKGGRYVLRTPHISTMMGSKEDVQYKIEELAREKPASHRTPGETRPLLSRNNGHDEMPFPMSSGWVRQLLHNEERNLVIMVGNHLSGLVEIENLKQPWLFRRGSQLDVKYFATIDAARTYVNTIRRLSANDPVDRVVAILPRSWKKEQIGEYAAFANSLSRPLITLDQRQRMANVRLLFMANPQQAWELAQMVHEHEAVALPANGYNKVAQRNWRIDPVPAWTEDAVYFRLKQLENDALADQHDVCAKILEATMGFGSEIYRVVRSSLAVDGIDEAKAAARRRLCANRQTFYQAIGWPETIEDEQTRHAEELLALLDGEVRSDTTSWAKDMNVSQAMMTFIRWMGLLLEAGDGTWRVPTLYKALITSKKQDGKAA